MTPITFTSYGVRNDKITVIAERIVSFFPIEYNGNRGTRIVLDGGQEITVSESHSEVTAAFAKAAP